MKTFRHILAGLALAFVTALSFAPSAQAQAASDYVENNQADYILRAQTWTIGANLYVGLSTTACSDSATGTEVSTSATNYARVAVARSLANWAGTQSAGSALASGDISGAAQLAGAAIGAALASGDLTTAIRLAGPRWPAYRRREISPRQARRQASQAMRRRSRSRPVASRPRSGSRARPQRSCRQPARSTWA